MIDALVLLAVLCGIIAAWRRDRTAWVLLASIALSSTLGWLGVPFRVELWFAIDLAAIAAIFWLCRLSASTIVVLTLFIPIWALYATDLPYAGDGVNLIVALQLFLTTPVRWIVATYRERARHAPDNWTEFDLRAAHDAA